MESSPMCYRCELSFCINCYKDYITMSCSNCENNVCLNCHHNDGWDTCESCGKGLCNSCVDEHVKLFCCEENDKKIVIEKYIS